MIDENLTSEHIGSLLRERGLMLATAESCSGGLLGHLLTNIPGSSDYYLGGVVAYSNQSKLLWLGVQPDTLAQYGAVSRETVLEMAAGLRRALGIHFAEERIIGLSISGVAGPGGGTVEKPVGMVWIGLISSTSSQAWQHHFSGNRLAVKRQSAEQALLHLLDHLLSMKKQA